MKKVTIKSSLVGKENCFNILALATACQMPLLINGEKGTAKTATVLDFAASLNNSKEESFIIELSEGTKVSHLLGQPDMKALMVDKDWKMKRPIASAKTVVINEVDKASSGVRNSLLSIMAEKEIFDGGERVACMWDTFVATSNEIPKGEENLPFWDRLVLRYDMQTVSIEDKIKFMMNSEVRDVMTINIPSMDEIKAQEIDFEYITKMMNLIDSHKINMSDRTLVKLHTLVKATMLIYEFSQEEAVIKVAEIVAKPIVAELAKGLLPIEVANFKSSKEMFDKATESGNNGNKMAMRSAVLNIQSALNAVEKNPKLKAKYFEQFNEIYKSSFEVYEKSKPAMEESF